jgi:hypothetical protein
MSWEFGLCTVCVALGAALLLAFLAALHLAV